ncbi:hypothetical protein D3C87_145670 [compost metagenome]
MFAAIFGNSTAEKVLLYIANYGEGHTRAIANTFEISSSQVYQQLIRLEQDGILISKAVGRTKVFSFNPRLAIRKPLLALLEEILMLVPESDQKKYYRIRSRPRKTGKSL